MWDASASDNRVSYKSVAVYVCVMCRRGLERRLLSCEKLLSGGRLFIRLKHKILTRLREFCRQVYSSSDINIGTGLTYVWKEYINTEQKLNLVEKVRLKFVVKNMFPSH